MNENIVSVEEELRRGLLTNILPMSVSFGNLAVSPHCDNNGAVGAMKIGLLLDERPPNPQQKICDNE